MSPTYSLTTVTLPSGPTYEYLHIAASSKTKPTILFLHGFPSSLEDWHHQTDYFSSLGYGILAPNLLGYGGTDQPTDMLAYKGKRMADEIAELLDYLSIDKCIGVAHDWGSFLLSRLATFHPDRILKYIFVDVGYLAPGNALDTPTIMFVNDMVKKHMGYSVFGYFLFFDEEDAATLIDKNPDSIQSLFHTPDPELIKSYMGEPGGTRTWVTEGRVAEWPSYLSEEEKNHNRELFSLKNGIGGYGPAMNWYRAQINGINTEDEKAVPKEDHIIKQPTLFIHGTKNPITMASNPGDSMKPLVPDLTIKQYPTGHWVQLEAPDMLNKDLQEFLEK